MIKISGSLVPTTLDTPIDVRTRIEKLSDVSNIPLPYVGMEFYVISEQAKYRVESLGNAEQGGAIAANVVVKEYRKLEDKGGFGAVIASIKNLNEILSPFKGMIFYVEDIQRIFIVLSTRQIILNNEIVTVTNEYKDVFASMATLANKKEETLNTLGDPQIGQLFYVESENKVHIVVSTKQIIREDTIVTVVDEIKEVEAGISEAPYDEDNPNRKYVRQNGQWIEIEAGIPEAPYDPYNPDKIYVRQKGRWVELKLDQESGGGVEVVPPEETTESMYYGYLDNLSDLSDLSDPSDLTEANCRAITKLSLGSGEAGQMLVVAIPRSSTLVAKKFDGISSAVAFDETYGGANGEVVGDYKLYGEFLLVTGERFIYVQ